MKTAQKRLPKGLNMRTLLIVCEKNTDVTNLDQDEICFLEKHLSPKQRIRMLEEAKAHKVPFGHSASSASNSHESIDFDLVMQAMHNVRCANNRPAHNAALYVAGYFARTHTQWKKIASQVHFNYDSAKAGLIALRAMSSLSNSFNSWKSIHSYAPETSVYRLRSIAKMAETAKTFSQLEYVCGYIIGNVRIRKSCIDLMIPLAETIHHWRDIHYHSRPWPRIQQRALREILNRARKFDDCMEVFRDAVGCKAIKRDALKKAATMANNFPNWNWLAKKAKPRSKGHKKAVEKMATKADNLTRWIEVFNHTACLPQLRAKALVNLVRRAPSPTSFVHLCQRLRNKTNVKTMLFHLVRELEFTQAEWLRIYYCRPRCGPRVTNYIKRRASD